MPAYEPGGTIAIVLDVDSKKDNPPAFIVKALSARESLKLLSSLDAAIDAGDTAKQLEALDKILCDLVCGWIGFDVEFAPEKLLDVLSIPDAWRLGYAIARQVSAPEKKG
jgi:hypothetical protein